VKPYFDTDERIARLIFEAESWKGTPWGANSETKGVAVACHNLPRAIYIAVGAWPQSFERVVGDPNGTKHSRVSVMEPLLDACPHVAPAKVGLEYARPGDLIGLRIFRCTDHLGVVLTPGPLFKFIHVMMHKRVAVDELRDPTWTMRMTRIWRPIE